MTWTGIFYHVICYLGFSKMGHTDEMFWSEFFHLRVCFKMDVLADVARDWLGWALAVFTQGCLSRRLPGSLNAKHGLPSSVCFFVSSPPTNIHYQTLSYSAYHTHAILTPSTRYSPIDNDLYPRQR